MHKEKEMELAAYIDHTVLKADAVADEIEMVCDEAIQYGFATVCIQPCWVPLAAQRLAGSKVGITTVIGFPLGASMSSVKAYEAEQAIAAGATEIDMVINVGLLKSGAIDGVKEDIALVAEVCFEKAVLKVILETGLLTDEEKIVACKLAVEAGADYVKTSTGFGKGGATEQDIALMRTTVGPMIGVKASGGVRDEATARLMLAAGATRIGASASVAIVTGGRGSGY